MKNDSMVVQGSGVGDQGSETRNPHHFLNTAQNAANALITKAMAEFTAIEKSSHIGAAHLNNVRSVSGAPRLNSERGVHKPTASE
ncbi:MAG: hypothetical protein WBQ94_09825 [Terracidiphilus sp.]